MINNSRMKYSVFPGSPVGFYNPISGKELFTYNPFDKTTIEYNSHGINLIIDGNKTDVEKVQKMLNEHASDKDSCKDSEDTVQLYSPLGMYGVVQPYTSTNYSGTVIHVILS